MAYGNLRSTLDSGRRGYSRDRYSARAFSLGGTSDYLLRSSDLTSNADGRKGTGSFWIKFNGGDGSAQQVYGNTGQRINLVRRTDNILRVRMDQVGGATALQHDTTSTMVASSAWRHVCFSYDLDIPGSSQLFLDDVSQGTATTFVAADIDYTRNEHSVGATTAGTFPLNGCIADLYLNLTQRVDLSVEANRRKFVGSGVIPVNFGSDGSLPTGTSPRVFLNTEFSALGNNLGTGGNFVVQGSPSICSDRPS